MDINIDTTAFAVTAIGFFSFGVVLTWTIFVERKERDYRKFVAFILTEPNTNCAKCEKNYILAHKAFYVKDSIIK